MLFFNKSSSPLSDSQRTLFCFNKSIKDFVNTPLVAGSKNDLLKISSAILDASISSFESLLEYVGVRFNIIPILPPFLKQSEFLNCFIALAEAYLSYIKLA